MRLKRLARWRRRLIVLGVFSFLGLWALLVAAYMLALLPELPRMRAGGYPGVDLATLVYSADGRELGRYYRENRTWVGVDAISPQVVDALVATEDHRFYEHHGVDLWRTLGALLRTAGGEREGGSTITMQLARNLYPEVGRAVSLDRKLKEMMTALKIERAYGKREILEMYLNTVPFSYNTFGIEAAARLYYDKPAAALDVAEAATLVGMLKGPTRYNPVRNPELARQRRDVVYGQMVKHGYLAPFEAARLRDEPLYLDFHPEALTTGPAPYFNEYVRLWLEAWAARHGYDAYADGLRVYTTLDMRLQEAAQAAVAEAMRGLQAVVDYEWSRASPALLSREADAYERARTAGRFEPFAYLWQAHPDLLDRYVRETAPYRRAIQQGARPDAALAHLLATPAFLDSLRTARTRLSTGLVAIDPHTGHVKAWVGGRDFAQDKYDKVALAKRQPGSTFKPFVYAAAIDHGYAPYYTLQDSAMSFRIPGTTRYWQPHNAGGGYSGRYVTLREALVQSKNTVTAQLMDVLGAFEVGGYARRMGITSQLDYVPSLGLGTSEVTLLELVSAYGTFAANGIHRPPVVVTRIEDRHGRVIARFEPEAREALSPHTAYTVLDMLRGVTAGGGTGARIRWRYGIDADVAGKTGTTQNEADGWFVLVHPNLVTGAWVGFNDRRLTFRTDYWGQGGHNALNVVGAFFRRVLGQGAADARARFIPPPGYRAPRPPAPPDTLHLHATSPVDPVDPAGGDSSGRQIAW